MDNAADLIVLGGGPAGAIAALAASEAGLRVTLIDEAAAVGGQVYKPPPAAFTTKSHATLGPDEAQGVSLRRAIEQSQVRCLFGRTVWQITPGFTVEALGPDGLEVLTAPALIAATGTYERIIPVPGWTLPCVIGLGAATLLVKSQHVLPGRRTVVAGCGPLLAVAAAGIVKGGGEVPALADLNGPIDYLRALPSMVRRPERLRQGFAWMRQIRRAGTRIYWRHSVVDIVGNEQVEEIHLAPVDEDWRPRLGARRVVIKADAVALGHGLVPSTEVTRLLGAKHDYVADKGGWIAVLDDCFRTSRPGLYVAGDAAGIAGAAAAALRGRVAGLAAAFDLGRISQDRFSGCVDRTKRELQTEERFASGIRQLMCLRPALLDLIAADTIVCRCEDVTRKEIDDALSSGARHLNVLKAWTRCGMGACQGRMCGETVGLLAARTTGSREAAGQWTMRAPIRPLPYDVLTGDYDYTDIPALPPAPP